jgi:hypothetical protein
MSTVQCRAGSIPDTLPNSVMPAPSIDPCCAILSRVPVMMTSPDGQITARPPNPSVQPPAQKYFAFPEMQIRCRKSCPVPTRGAYRDRHGRGVRDAMDAAVRQTSAARRGRPSRVVPIPRRWDQPLGLITGPGGRWLSSPAHRGEREAAVNTIARGMPACFGQPAVTNSRDYHFTREAAGAACTRHSLRPLYAEGHI